LPFRSTARTNTYEKGGRRKKKKGEPIDELVPNSGRRCAKRDKLKRDKQKRDRLKRDGSLLPLRSTSLMGWLRLVGSIKI